MKFPGLLGALLFMLATLNCQGQIIVFDTFEDFVNKKPSVEIPAHYKKKNSAKGWIWEYVNKETKEKITVDISKIWGFIYMDQIFRIWKNGKYSDLTWEDFPVMLAYNVDGAYYWTNGDNMLSLREGSSTVQLNSDAPGFLSASLDGDALRISGSPRGGKKIREHADRFFKDHPELKWLQQCVQEKTMHSFMHYEVTECLRAASQRE